jgi:GNAT superfamily N-acetyltransferase
MTAPFVRPAVPEDADGIGLVHVRSWQSAYRGKMPQGCITGFASFGPSRDSDTDPRVTGEVSAIYAAPDAWGTGTGRALMGSAVSG